MRLKSNWKLNSKLLGFLLFGMGMFNTSYAQKLEKNVEEQTKNVNENVESQKKVDSAAEQTDTAVETYKDTLSKIDNLKIYNAQLKDLLKSQNDEKTSLMTQISTIEKTSQGVVPMMVKMIDTIEQFVQLDVPFLPEERANRIKNLKEMMKRADVSTSEKYRRVLEAYQVENEYGRTIEAYSGNLDLEGKSFAVNFLRIGRIGLMYQSIDGKKTGMWDSTKKAWQLLDDSHTSSVKQGIAIAKKQTAPDLLSLPIKAAEAL